jgi:MinD-like ATPase involved in chromosome partitioning or flagellar assembly
MCSAVLLYSWPDLPAAFMGGPVSSTDPHHDGTQTAPWQYAEQTETPENPGASADEAAPSWLGYQPEPVDHARTPAYPPDAPAHVEYSPPQYVDPPDVQPEHAQPGAEVPAGAGMVPPRADATPPSSEQAQTPAPEPAQAQTTAWSATDYSSAQRGHTEAPERHRPDTDVRHEPSGPVPRPEDLLVPDRPAITDAPAQWGWRGRVNRLSAGAIKPTPKAAELADRQAVQDIQRGFSRPMTVVVIQPKGGAGKTPTAIGLASALGASRGGYVIVWDDNETRGTLAVRVVNRDSQRTTVWDLLGELASFERPDARVGDLGYYVRSQGEAYFDALVSDDHPAHMAQIGEDEFHRIHAVLQRFYRLIVIDTGNNVRSPNWQAAVNAADVVVVPSTYQRDVGYSGSWVLDHLIQTGREELADHAVTVLTAADPDPDRKVRKELVHHFGARTQSVVEIPHDPHIATGGPMHWNRLNVDTRRAWVQLGAVVVHALAQRDMPMRSRDEP